MAGKKAAKGSEGKKAGAKARSAERKAGKKPKSEKKEAPKPIKIFTIPLRKAYEKTRKKRAPYSVRIVRKFLESHLKTKEIRLGKKLNEKIWERSIQKPPRKIKVGVFRSGTGYAAELEGFGYEEFRPTAAKKPEGLAEKLTSRLGGKALKNLEEEKLAEGKEEKPEDTEEKK